MSLSSSVANVLIANGFLPASSRLKDAQVLVAQAQAAEETIRQEEILLVRRYHDGKQDVHLDIRLQQWLYSDSGGHKPNFTLNLVRKVTEALVEKLRFDGVDVAKIELDREAFVKQLEAARIKPKPPALLSPAPVSANGAPPAVAPTAPAEPEEPEPLSEELIEQKWQLAWAGHWMTEANLGMAIDDAFEMAVRDGEAFLFVFPNDDKKRKMFPRVIAQPRYTDPTISSGDGENLISGDGYGCMAYYPHGDTRLKPEFISKRWTEYPEIGLLRQRENLYFPDRIEFWYRDMGAVEWEEFQDPENGGKTSIPWTYAEGPIGIPIIHIKKSDMRPSALDAIRVSDAVMKVVVDLLAAADLTAFQIIVTRGWFPTKDGNPPDEDGTNLLEISPGRIIGTGGKASETGTDVIKSGDLTPLLELLRTLIIYLAVICNLPTSRYNTTGNIASEETLKEQDEPILSAVRRLQKPFGDAMEEVYTIGRRLANIYGSMDFDEDLTFRALWGKSETRSTMDLLQELAIKREKLHLPLRQLWIESGYTEAQVEGFMKEPEIKAFLERLEQSIGDAMRTNLEENQLKNSPQVPGGAPGQGRAAAKDQPVNNLRNTTVRGQ